MRRSKQQKLLYYTSPRFYLNVLKQMEEIEEKVCWILAKVEHTRNCDTCLLFYYWQHINDPYTHLLYKFETERHKLTASESITRARRYIQNVLGLWMPTDEEVIKKRRIKEMAMKEWAIIHSREFKV